MKILVTGAKGFIGKNLILALKNNGYHNVLEYDVDDDTNLLDEFCNCCDFVFHLAGVNRPQDFGEYKNNVDFTKKLLGLLNINVNSCPIVFASSVQAELNNPYGKSKKEAEDLVFNHEENTKAKALIYRFPNIFGKWCNPNYNSAVATFCYNIANDFPITVNDKDTIINLVYIDDLMDELIRALKGQESKVDKFCVVPVVYTEKLGTIADIIKSFSLCQKELTVPNLSNILVKKLYATYLSYLPKEKFKYKLNSHSNDEGSFTEFMKTNENGQFSINIIKPGVTKGNHWHNTKNEKFLIISGNGIVRFRLPNNHEIFEIKACGTELEVIEIPTGYTHSIENIGNNDMIVLIWASELYTPGTPDTYSLEV